MLDVMLACWCAASLSHIPASACPDVHKGCASLADASHDFEHVQLAYDLWCQGLQFKPVLHGLCPLPVVSGLAVQVCLA